MFSLIRDDKGQLMPFVALIALALVMFWMTTVNVGKLARERIRMQNAADAAALTGVRYQARGLNLIAVMNDTLLVMGIPWYIPAIPLVEMKPIVRGIIEAQETINGPIGGGYTWWKVQEVAQANAPGCSFPLTNPAGIFSLRLHRHKGCIVYYKIVCCPLGCAPIPWDFDWNTKMWYEREWSGRQPPHNLFFKIDKQHQVAVGGGTLGVGSSTISTIAKGEVWLNSASNWGDWGCGFPSKNAWHPVSYPAKFDARLVPVSYGGVSFLH